MSALLEARNLRKNFGGLAVTNDASIVLHPGDRMAPIGPNGAEKTTFINLVTGNLKPSGGEVLLCGEDVTHLGPAARVRRGLIRSFQVTRLFLDMTPEEDVAFALLQREGRSGSMLGHYSRTPLLMEEIGATLNLLGLGPLARVKTGAIAYGQRRLLEIALAKALRPRVLLLDEPAAGVPQSETRHIEQALGQLPDNLAVLMIDHDMDLVFRFATRVVVLAAGTVIFDGSPEHVTRDARVREVYLGSYANAGNAA